MNRRAPRVRRPRDRRRRRRPARGDRRGRAGRAHGAGLQVAARQGAHGDGRGRRRGGARQRRARRQLAGPFPGHDVRRQVPEQLAMAELHAKEAPDRVRELEQWGGVFDRTPERKMSQRAFGGHTYRRLVHIGDRTGLELIRTLQDKAVHAGIDVFMECTITRLLKDGDRVCGALRLPPRDGRVGRVRRAGARARDRRRGQVLADHVELVGVHRRRPRARLRGRRGADRHGVRPVPPDRDGVAAGRHRPARHRGGARRGRDPAQLRAASASWSATTRSGSSSRPATWSRARSTPRSRRAAARRTAACSSTSRTCRPTTVRSKLPSMYDQFMELAGVDITREPMEVGPTCHYFMGGIRVDAETGASTVPGLFATGECSGGMNGANRLGGNSLSDLLVFGRRAGEGAARHAADAPAPQLDEAQIADAAAEMTRYLSGPGDEDPYRLHAELQATMQRRRRDLPRRGRADRGGRAARGARAARRRRSFAVEHDRVQPRLASVPRRPEHADRLAGGRARGAAAPREPRRSQPARLPRLRRLLGRAQHRRPQGLEGMRLEPTPVLKRTELAPLVEERKEAERG